MKGFMQKVMQRAKQDKETFVFSIWFVLLAAYYGVRMFALTPWYDELYTYYYFISKGPVYAAIHWPLPNNHIGYSALSGFLNYLGSPYIGLRGISFAASLLSVVVLYVVCRKIMKKGWSVCCVILFSAMNLVNQLAVQGRGYALCTLCLLCGIWALEEICMRETGEKKIRKFEVLFSCSLILGLYAVPSSVYWVLPLCMAGGVFLLLSRAYKKLIRLIVAGILSALTTLFLYAVVWLAIGSNLLSKTQESLFFGRGHVDIILSSPLQSLKTGIDYMLATPYIQSVGAKEFAAKLTEWILYLFNYFYDGFWLVLALCVITGSIAALARGVLKRKEEKTYLFLVTAVLFLLWMPLMLLTVQSVLPYFRVFSYLGVPLSIIICLLGQMFFPEKLPYGIYIGMAAAAGVLLLASPGYNSQYGMSEYYAMDALRQANPGKDQKWSVTDCNQQYLLKFGWDIECESTQIPDAELVLLSKELTDPEKKQVSWEYYHSYDTIPWDYIREEMNISYENDAYILYMKK